MSRIFGSLGIRVDAVGFGIGVRRLDDIARYACVVHVSSASICLLGE
jgi:hypothetical protein